MLTTDVLIIGGGPVGLTLALALSRLGVQATLVNERPDTTSQPWPEAVNCRSMEIFRQLGLADAIRDQGNPRAASQAVAYAPAASEGQYGPYGLLDGRRHLAYQSVAEATATIRACPDGSLPLEPMQRIAQAQLEPVLLKSARAEANIDLRFGWKIFGFEQDNDGVTALIQHVETWKNQHVRARYLIGCDGADSRVRNFINIDYDGLRDATSEAFRIHLRSGEIRELFPQRAAYWHTWLCRPGFAGLLVAPDAHRDDYVLHRASGPGPGETVEQLVDAALGQQVRYEIVQSGPWSPQSRVAESFGRGRVFIAGEATHQYLPPGGLGLDTGLAEAHNLAWKLAALVQGWGGDRLLASYEAERRPVAGRNRDHAQQCAAAAAAILTPLSTHLLDNSVAGQEARRQAQALFEAKMPRLYESLGIEIGYRYPASPVVCPDAEVEPAGPARQYLPTTHSGARLPSAFREDGTAVFDLLGAGFTLLILGGSAAQGLPLRAAAEAVGMPLQIRVFHEPQLARIYEKKFVLVRPDQHVAWRGNTLPDNCLPLLHRVRGAG